MPRSFPADAGMQKLEVEQCISLYVNVLRYLFISDTAEIIYYLMSISNPIHVGEDKYRADSCQSH